MSDLLSSVKRRLRISWDYDDEEIEEIIEEAKDFFRNRISNVDFEDVTVKKLIKEYCRYSWSNASEVFENDYKSEILNLQLKYASVKSENEK